MQLLLYIVSTFSPTYFALASDIRYDITNEVDEKKIHEIAKKIRQYTKWQILGVKSEEVKQGPVKKNQLFRFKLLGENGDVKIMSVDPDNFDFYRQLE